MPSKLKVATINYVICWKVKSQTQIIKLRLDFELI